MRRAIYAATGLALAASFLAMSDRANALTIDGVTMTVVQSSLSNDTTATSSTNITPTSHSGDYAVINYSTADVTLSPFGPASSLFYTSLSLGSTGTGSATYNTIDGNFNFLWGSPDSYNLVTFYSGADGAGTPIATFTGSDLGAPGQGYDIVDFSFNLADVGSVVLSDTGQAAFEYADVDPAPLPPTFYMVAGGLALLGFLAWRKNRAQKDLATFSAA